MLGRDGPGAGEQIAGAGVIAEPRPGGHDLAVLRGGERLDRRPARRERLEIGLHRGDRGLLQHHLATARRDRGRARAALAPATAAAAYPQHTNTKALRRHRRAWAAYAMLAAKVESRVTKTVEARKKRAAEPRPLEARARGFGPAAAGRRRRLPPLRLRPVLDRQPLARDRRRPLRRRLVARIDPLPARQEELGHAHPDRRGRARADDAACRAGDHRAGQRLLRLSGGRADRLPPGHRSGGAGKVAAGAAVARADPGRARRFAARGRRSRSCAPVSNRLRAGSRTAKERRW